MWLVRVALQRPYTFVILSFLILIAGITSILTTPMDILPEINIPVISVVFTYNGLSADDMAARVVTVCERSLSTTVNNIQRIESQSYYGVGIIKIYFQPSVHVDLAMAQVTSLAQSVLRTMPPGIYPPQILKYDASSVPILQLSLGGQGLSQAQLYDFGENFIREQLATVEGAAVPHPYGGEMRAVMVDAEPTQLASRHLTGADLSNAINLQNLILPSGTEKIGKIEYLVGINSSPAAISELNNLPIRSADGAVIKMSDVAWIHDGFQPQTSFVRENGIPAALLTVTKNGAFSTVTIVNQVIAALPRIKAGLPKALTIHPLDNQALLVTASLRDVVQEAVTAAVLTALMVLVFLGSWRSTLIVGASIPLAILFSITAFSALGATINTMTLGGLALAVGMLVDDATVEIENTYRNLGINKPPVAVAILDSAEQVAVPALVSTMCICIVFIPVTLLSGAAKFIFTPLALAVVFAMIASYLLSRTLVPLLQLYLMPGELSLYQGESDSPQRRSKLWRFHLAFERQFDRFQGGFSSTLEWALAHRILVLSIFAGVSLASCGLAFVLGENFFPYVDAGEMQFHVRPPPGTRIEVSQVIFAQIDAEIRRIIPPDQVGTIMDNIGMPPGGINLVYSTSDVTSNGDGDILIQLSAKHRPTQEWMRILRSDLAKTFPEETFFFEPADITSQTLDFGLPAPINVKVIGQDTEASRKIAVELRNRIQNIRGAVDVFIQQENNEPQIDLDVDRLRSQEFTLTQKDIAENALLALSGSQQTAPNFWLNLKTGVEYPVIVMTPQARLDTISALTRTTINSPLSNTDQLLSNVSETRRTVSPMIVSHYNIQPVLDVYASVDQRDLGGVSRDIEKIIGSISKSLPAGTRVKMSGQVETMNSSFLRLGIGVVAAVVFVYLLMALNFQSWTDPIVILTALPGAMAGVLWMLFLTQTTFSVPSLMGALMTIGVATANSILVVTFANGARAEGKDALTAALEAGRTRLRPVCMTALAMILGMFPMALALGSGGEQNAPIGRAVIGGLLFATVGTLFIVPISYSLLRGKAPVNFEKRLESQIKGEVL
uniref:Acriflavin resistance protein n=1 Tax=mine drainage metagenome TaxID=410659 RepID=E6QLL0_9ZZZZ